MGDFIRLLKRFSEARGPFEDEVRKVVTQEMRPYATTSLKHVIEKTSLDVINKFLDRKII